MNNCTKDIGRTKQVDSIDAIPGLPRNHTHDRVCNSISQHVEDVYALFLSLLLCELCLCFGSSKQRERESEKAVSQQFHACRFERALLGLGLPYSSSRFVLFVCCVPAAAAASLGPAAAAAAIANPAAAAAAPSSVL